MHNHKKLIFSLLSILILISLLFHAFRKQEPQVSLIKSSFSQLPHWQNDDHTKALLAFKQSCIDILKRNPNKPFGLLQQNRLNHDWQTICTAASKLSNPDNKTAQQFFETWFQPYFVKSTLKNDHLFTGYYIPLLHASLQKTNEYNVPIYGLPNDLIKVNLSAFNPALPNKTIVGQLKKDRLIPYPDRIAINHGSIDHSATILAWTHNLIDLFFAQIQGSLFIELPNKQERLLSYAGTNGRPYTAIGKILIANHELKKEEVSMQSIRTWLEEHPQKISSILDQNASYIFFKFSDNHNPIGNEGVPLTPQRSLAVDMNYTPLGTPIWLDTTLPDQHSTPFQHLVIAQDTGGAIKGAVRGDIYWGTGEQAAFLAGHMQSPGQYWLLLPRQELHPPK